MANIGLAKQSSANNVNVYDEKGMFKFSKQGVLVGFTATTVSIKTTSGMINVYDEKGMFKFSR